MQKNHSILAIAVIIATMLACNLPSNTPNQPSPDAVLTAAALTVQAQLSANNTPTLPPANTAVSASSTNTPTVTPVPPTFTPAPAATATSNCDNALFITDVTYADNTVVPASSTFTKTWRLQNIGSCSWTPSYALVFVSGDVMNGPTTQALSGNVNPGQTVDISVNLQAPSSNGTYTGNWGLRNASGVIFTRFYVKIKVNGGGGGGSIFAVTSVNFSVTGSCPNFDVSVNITTNAAGTVTYHFLSSDSSSTSPTSLVFSSAGTQTISFARYFGAAHSSLWTDIYIDSPNHQQFGRATFSCP